MQVIGFEGFDAELSGTDIYDILAQWFGEGSPFRRGAAGDPHTKPVECIRVLLVNVRSGLVHTDRLCPSGDLHHRQLLQGVQWQCPSDDSDCRCVLALFCNCISLMGPVLRMFDCLLTWRVVVGSDSFACQEASLSRFVRLSVLKCSLIQETGQRSRVLWDS